MCHLLLLHFLFLYTFHLPLCVYIIYCAFMDVLFTITGKFKVLEPFDDALMSIGELVTGHAWALFTNTALKHLIGGRATNTG